MANCKDCLHVECCEREACDAGAALDYSYAGECDLFKDRSRFVEVVHGRWERVIPTKSAAKWSIKVSCSVCHRQGYTHHKYCHNCGAKMDKED